MVVPGYLLDSTHTPSTFAMSTITEVTVCTGPTRPLISFEVFDWALSKTLSKSVSPRAVMIFTTHLPMKCGRRNFNAPDPITVEQPNTRQSPVSAAHRQSDRRAFHF